MLSSDSGLLSDCAVRPGKYSNHVSHVAYGVPIDVTFMDIARVWYISFYMFSYRVS